MSDAAVLIRAPSTPCCCTEPANDWINTHVPAATQRREKLKERIVKDEGGNIKILFLDI